MVAGEAAAIDRARPFLDAAGRFWLTTGASGTAAIAKALNNGVGAVTLCAIAEALALAEHHGIAPAVLVEAMRKGAGAGASVVLDRHGPHMAAAAKHQALQPDRQEEPGAGRPADRRAGTALPMLAAMVETYRCQLADARTAAPEILTRHAQKTLAEAHTR